MSRCTAGCDQVTKELTDNQIVILNDKFADLIRVGKIFKTPALLKKG